MKEIVSNKTTKNEIGNQEKVQEVVKLVSALIVEGQENPLNLEQIENKTTEIFKIIRQQSAKQLIESQDPVERKCPQCGLKMKIKEYLPRKIKGLASYGFRRRSFYCKQCNCYEQPLDSVIGCKDGYTKKVSESIILLGQRLPFAESEHFLELLLGVTVSNETIQEKTEATGERISAEEKKRVKEVIDTESHYVKTDLLEKQEPIIQDTAYLMMDGSMVSTRDAGWKEVRLGVLFREKHRMEIDRHHIQISSKKYFATANNDDKSLQHFKDRATQEAYDFGFHRYKNQVILGDGAIYIWDYASTYHPEAIQILDYYHACEYLMKAIQSLLNYTENERVRLKRVMTRKLNAGHIQRIIEWLAKQRQTKEVIDCDRYYCKNQERMQYRKYRRMGLCIGSGAIESAHRTVIQTRMKLSGMHWKLANVQAMVSLRAKVLSNEWLDVTQRFLSAA